MGDLLGGVTMQHVEGLKQERPLADQGSGIPPSGDDETAVADQQSSGPTRGKLKWLAASTADAFECESIEVDTATGSGEDWRHGPWDGIGLSHGWVEHTATPEDLALVALASLSCPVFLDDPMATSGSSAKLKALSKLAQPLSVSTGISDSEASRLKGVLERSRLRMVLPDVSDRPTAFHAIFGRIAEPCSLEVSGLVHHGRFQFVAPNVIAEANRENMAVSCIAFEVRWPNGAPARLSARGGRVVDAYVRAALRGADIVGRLDEHIYLAVLPGQSLYEAMVPARRLADLNLSAAVPSASWVPRVAVGISNRASGPPDGLAVLAEADRALSGAVGGGPPRVYGPDRGLDGVMGGGWAMGPLDPRARLIDMRPGLFRCPVSDRAFEGVISALGEVVPTFDLARGMQLAHWADLLCTLLGRVGPHVRRILARACLLSGLVKVAPTSTAPTAGCHDLNFFSQIMDASPLLKMECLTLINAHRLLCGLPERLVAKSSPLYWPTRIFEIVDALHRLAFEEEAAAGAQPLTLSAIIDNLSTGAGWRYDPEILEAMLQWLKFNGAEELGR